MVKNFYIFLFIFHFLISTRIVFGQQSPCPTVFQYKNDSLGRLYGIVSVPVPNVIENNSLELHVDLSVGNLVDDLQSSRNYITFYENEEDVAKKQLLIYRIDFPPWTTIFPRIIKITLNGIHHCSGPSIILNDVGTETTINLVHKSLVNFNPKKSFIDSLTSNFFLTLGGINNQVNPQPTKKSKGAFFLKIGAAPDFSISQSLGNNWLQSTNIFSTSPPTFNSFINSFATQSNQNVFPKLNVKECGESINSNKLIVHGKDVKAGEHPWIGALFWQENSKSKYKCGATLISENRALTAGHCIINFPKVPMFLVFGRISIEDWFNKDTQVFEVASTVLHPQYNYHSADADIGVVIFSQKAIFSTTVKPICIWSPDSSIDTIIGEEGVVLGWGSDEDRNIGKTLKKTSASIVSQEDCLRSHSAFNSITSNRTFCAGNRNDTGPCDGDSGSGLYFFTNNKWSIRGIVSHSINRFNGRCDLRHYVVYVDVSKFLYWLQTCCN